LGAGVDAASHGVGGAIIYCEIGLMYADVYSKGVARKSAKPPFRGCVGGSEISAL
jgi:hypothetical protein